MKLGVAFFSTEYSIDPRELARELEARGFESLFLTEHTHIPTSRRSPWPGGPVLPEEYKHTLDPFATLAAVACVTERLMIGTGVCLVVEHDPILLAKQVATLDHLSKGRFVFGIGAGWNLEEMANHGTDPRTRWKLLRERVEAMKAIWADEAAEYHGELVNFDPIWQWPKPVQEPHPPLLLGSNTEQAIGRVLRYCDGWFPIAARVKFDLLAKVRELRALTEEQGRPSPSPTVTVYGAPADLGVLESWSEGGIDRALLIVPSNSRDVALTALDRYQTLLDGLHA